jgi:hypothetical protein
MRPGPGLIRPAPPGSGLSGDGERQRSRVQVSGARGDRAFETQDRTDLLNIACVEGRAQLVKGQDARVDRTISEPLIREADQEDIPVHVEVAGVRQPTRWSCPLSGYVQVWRWPQLVGRQFSELVGTAELVG